MVYKDELEILIAALPVSWAIWRYGIKPAFKNINESLVALQSIDTLHKRVQALQADLKPNGGSSLRDVVDRVENLVIAANTTQQAILDILDSGFFQTDSHGNYAYVNRYWLQLTGIPQEEAVGTGWLVCVHPDDRDKIQKDWSIAAEEGRAFSTAFRIINKNTNKESTVTCYSVPLRDNSGRVYGHIGSIVENQ